MVACGGACVVAPGGHVWLLGGACVVAHVGVCGCSRGACMVALGGCAWDTTRYGDTINEWAVRILLECILVCNFLENVTKSYVGAPSCGESWIYAF